MTDRSREYTSLLSIPSVFTFGPEADAEFEAYDRLRARVRAELEGLIGTKAHQSFGSFKPFHFPFGIETTDLWRLLDGNGFSPLTVNGESEDLESLMEKIRRMRILTESNPAYPVRGEGDKQFRRFEFPAISISYEPPESLVLNFGHLRQVDSGWNLANSHSGEIRLYPLSDLTYFKAE